MVPPYFPEHTEAMGDGGIIANQMLPWGSSLCLQPGSIGLQAEMYDPGFVFLYSSRGACSGCPSARGKQYMD